MAEALPISLALPFFIVGVVILVKGADVFTDGATRLARALRVSGFVIGVTLVAAATSLPELSIIFPIVYSSNPKDYTAKSHKCSCIGKSAAPLTGSCLSY